jgi:protein-S-isoprenylcysteine O-methyltransferase Ste14
MSLKPSTGGSTAPDLAHVYTLLARWRVPLGFAGVFATLLLAHPTWRTLAVGGGMVLFGEAVRVWAAGHLEKGREVTRSGPYRWSAHPLYVGSGIIGTGLAIASARAAVAVLALVYLGTTLTAAIRTEEAELRAKFGD